MDECPICLNYLQYINQTIAILECNHRYHLSCLNNWYSQPGANYRCPSCHIQREIRTIINTPVESMELLCKVSEKIKQTKKNTFLKKVVNCDKCCIM